MTIYVIYIGQAQIRMNGATDCWVLRLPPNRDVVGAVFVMSNYLYETHSCHLHVPRLSAVTMVVTIWSILLAVYTRVVLCANKTT